MNFELKLHLELRKQDTLTNANEMGKGSRLK